MKKSRLLIALAGLTLVASGCGYSTGGEDSTVTVIKATPTPTATPTPAATPTRCDSNTGAADLSDSKRRQDHTEKCYILCKQ